MVLIPEKDINGAVLRENPVPTSVQLSKQLRDYFIEILGEKSKLLTVAIDSVLEKSQKCNPQSMDPLSRLWVDLEEVRH